MLQYERKVHQDVIISYGMPKSLFRIKKSLISDVEQSDLAVERTLPDSRDFFDNEDLLTFVVLKGKLKKANNESYAQIQSQEIARILVAIEATMPPSRNCYAFGREKLVQANYNGYLNTQWTSQKGIHLKLNQFQLQTLKI
ncbi:MAG: hypothetical protein EZS28_021872 [Streblomastix strix]|uniref:Uncharacterized protein n=1 Tax=Streblomastix strix TaxID=222440 RepID=A0A5J4VJ34_9EUKA|nr:MAG: hypothetical protein EZS28_021872 [Streblomastix strix]